MDTDEPDLFSTNHQDSNSSENQDSFDQDEDDLEIPAFLRRQKN